MTLYFERHETEENFIDRSWNRLISSGMRRSETATDWYNRYAKPSENMTEENANWFNPFARRCFESYQAQPEPLNAFVDDVKSLIMKPCIFLALAMYEEITFFLSLASFAVQLVTLSPQGMGDALVDTAEAAIAHYLIEGYVAVELVLQVGSFLIRSGLSLGELMGIGGSEVENATASEEETTGHILGGCCS